MAQRFLLSAAARTLSLRSIYAEGEQAAYLRFCVLRWPETDGRPVCPACACLDVYDLRTRQRFKCAACHRQFSVTSGTIFASRRKCSAIFRANTDQARQVITSSLAGCPFGRLLDWEIAR